MLEGLARILIFSNTQILVILMPPRYSKQWSEFTRNQESWIQENLGYGITDQLNLSEQASCADVLERMVEFQLSSIHRSHGTTENSYIRYIGSFHIAKCLSSF